MGTTELNDVHIFYTQGSDDDNKLTHTMADIKPVFTSWASELTDQTLVLKGPTSLWLQPDGVMLNLQGLRQRENYLNLFSSIHLNLSFSICLSLCLLYSVSRARSNILYIYMWEKSEVERDRVQHAGWCTLIFFLFHWKCSSKQAILKLWNAHQLILDSKGAEFTSDEHTPLSLCSPEYIDIIIRSNYTVI